MNIRQYIEMEAVVHKKSVPDDFYDHMYEKNIDKLPNKYKYYSDSQGKYISIFDMEFHHFIRSFALMQTTDTTAVTNKLYEIKQLLEVA